jgi:head-tail adaptor
MAVKPTIGRLDRRAQFLRSEMIDDGLQTRPGPPAPFGPPVYAARRDISDAEKFAMDTVLSTLTARFVIRHTAFSETIKPSDSFICDGETWAIGGIKQLPEPRRRWLEITATRRAN